MYAECDTERDFEKVKISKKLINKQRYALHWPVNKIKHLAIRLQDTQHKFSPVDIRKMVQSYVTGVIRFAVSQKYLRGDKAQLYNINFFYGMAMSAVCGLNACEVFGLSVCKFEVQ
jgi:hypothetical protein